MVPTTLALYYDLLNDLAPSLPDREMRSLLRQEKGLLEPFYTPRQVAAISLANSFIKKSIDEISVDADQNALSKFLTCNRTCKEWVLNTRSSWDDELVGTFKNELYKFFNPTGDANILSDLMSIYSKGRCGPGAALGSEGGDFYTKLFSSKLTATSKWLIRAYERYVSFQPNWVNAELIRNIHYGRDNIVAGSRLSFVPKQRDTSRVICVEPILNMYGQLGIGACIEKRLKTRFGIDLAIQPAKNRELARIGSLDGSLFTCDLSSASDSISMKMLKHFLDPETLGFIEMLRSPCVELPSGEQVELDMVSTMGNGFTFPLQTAIFSCVLSTAMKVKSMKIDYPRGDLLGNFGVFGDDLAGPESCFGTVLHLLSLLGFQVNIDKSFNEGPFRESCGHDYYRGHNVRGVYIKTLKTPQDRAVVLNRLHLWSSMTGIMLSSVVKALYDSISYKVFVPYWESDDAGIKVPLSLIRSSLKLSKSTQSYVYKKWISKPLTISLYDWVYLARRKRIYNPYGLWIAFLAGHVRSGRIVARQATVRYRTKASVAPSWDPPRRLLVTGTSWQRWETAVWLTLEKS